MEFFRNNLTKPSVARKLAVGHLCVRQLVFWLLVVSSFNYFFKMHAWSTSMLLLLHSEFMLSVVKMLLKGEVGGRALNSHGNYIVDHGKSWKNHGIVFFEFLWEPCRKGILRKAWFRYTASVRFWKPGVICKEKWCFFAYFFFSFIYGKMSAFLLRTGGGGCSNWGKLVWTYLE